MPFAGYLRHDPIHVQPSVRASFHHSCRRLQSPIKRRHLSFKMKASEQHQPSVVVFSGGTAFNSVAERLGQWTTDVSYILPVSDDGGSTAEIIRVVGGPAIGDIRSRCLRLADQSDEEVRVFYELLLKRHESE